MIFINPFRFEAAEVFEFDYYETNSTTLRAFTEASGLVTPQSVIYNGATYAVGVQYNSENQAPAILKYKDGVFEFNDTIGVIDNNDPAGHNYPTIIIKAGFIYIAQVNGHGEDIKIWKSDAQEDISSFTLHHTIVGPFGYCNIRSLSDGRVAIYSRATAVTEYPEFTGENYSALYAISAVDDLTSWTLVNATQRGPIEVRHYTAPIYQYGVNEHYYIGINLRHSTGPVFFAQAIMKTKDHTTYSDIAETYPKNLVTGIYSASEVEDYLTITGSNTDTATFRGFLGGAVINDTVYCSYFDAESSVWKFKKIFRDGTIRDYACNIAGLPTQSVPNSTNYIRILFNGKNLLVLANEDNALNLYGCDLNFGNLQFLYEIYDKVGDSGLANPQIPWNIEDATGKYLMLATGNDASDSTVDYLLTNSKFEITLPDYTDFEIINPTAAETFDEGKDIVIVLNLNGKPDNITKVEYLYGATLIAEVTQAPFDSYRWQNAPVGAHTLTVKTYKSGSLFQTKTVDFEVTAAISSADAVSYWRWEETTSPFTDSISTNDAVQTNASNVSTATGKLGRGVEFVGANQLLEIPHNDNLSFVDVDGDLPFSIETWINIGGKAGNNKVIFEKLHLGTGNFEYGLNYNGSSNELIGRCFDPSSASTKISINAPFNVPTGGWHHVVFTYDGSGTEAGFKMYADGAEITGATRTQSGTYTGMANTGCVALVGNWDNHNADLIATLDETIIWSKELTLEEVQQRYNNGDGAILNV